MEKVLAIGLLKGGTTSFELGIVLTQELQVLTILMGGGGVAQKVSTFKTGWGARTVLPCLEGGGGGAKSFGPTIFPFCSPPSP